MGRVSQHAAKAIIRDGPIPNPGRATVGVIVNPTSEEYRKMKKTKRRPNASGSKKARRTNKYATNHRVKVKDSKRLSSGKKLAKDTVAHKYAGYVAVVKRKAKKDGKELTPGEIKSKALAKLRRDPEIKESGITISAKDFPIPTQRNSAGGTAKYSSRKADSKGRIIRKGKATKYAGVKVSEVKKMRSEKKLTSLSRGSYGASDAVAKAAAKRLADLKANKTAAPKKTAAKKTSSTSSTKTAVGKAKKYAKVTADEVSRMRSEKKLESIARGSYGASKAASKAATKRLAALNDKTSKKTSTKSTKAKTAEKVEKKTKKSKKSKSQAKVKTSYFKGVKAARRKAFEEKLDAIAKMTDKKKLRKISKFGPPEESRAATRRLGKLKLASSKKRRKNFDPGSLMVFNDDFKKRKWGRIVQHMAVGFGSFMIPGAVEVAIEKATGGALAKALGNSSRSGAVISAVTFGIGSFILTRKFKGKSALRDNRTAAMLGLGLRAVRDVFDAVTEEIRTVSGVSQIRKVFGFTAPNLGDYSVWTPTMGDYAPGYVLNGYGEWSPAMGDFAPGYELNGYGEWSPAMGDFAPGYELSGGMAPGYELSGGMAPGYELSGYGQWSPAMGDFSAGYELQGTGW